MTTGLDRKVVLITRRTRLEELVARFHTLAQAKFYVEHLGQDFREYENENETYQVSKRIVLEVLSLVGRYQVIDRAFLPNFIFGADDVVMALGQDGLVANTMKYLNGHPLVGVNPDPYRYDGILLPFDAKDVGAILGGVMRDERDSKSVSMALAQLSDGQELFAVNDLFIGPRSHVSARYEIRLGNHAEVQSSSGIIVSTGLGSTGWMKSVATGSVAIAKALGGNAPRHEYRPQPWDADRLQFAVREPFPSRSSSASLVFGVITNQQPMTLVSHMPENGLIFSDGIEADYVEFNAGTRAIIKIADRAGRLVV
jgi:NAD kinase